MRSHRRPSQYLFYTLACIVARAAYERRVREQKLRAEVMAAKRENAEFVQLVEQGKQIQKMEERKVGRARNGTRLASSIILFRSAAAAHADEPTRGCARRQSHARSEAHTPQVCKQREPSRASRDNSTNGARSRASFHQKESVAEGGSSRLVDDALLSQIFPASSK